MSFGGHMRALRQQAGLSRPELARRASVAASTLRNWEGDRDFPNLPALLRLAKARGVRVERLAEGVEDPAEDEPEAEGENSPVVHSLRQSDRSPGTRASLIFFSYFSHNSA
jgi:transcriptional regulator with XRE-family HTH domain